MKIALDTSCLALMLDPNATGPIDPVTGERLADGGRRIEYLIQTISKSGSKVVIPAMVLAEILVHSKSSGPDYLGIIERSSEMEIRAFDKRAAIELAYLDSSVFGKLKRTASSSRQKVKVDRQIVSVCKVNNVKKIYSDDNDLRSFAVRAGIEAQASWELLLPPEDSQKQFDF